jgi:hypothetical protein
VAPNVNLEGFLRFYGGLTEAKKLNFPYEYITSFEILHQTAIPKKADFFSSLKQTHISDGEYENFKTIWNGMDQPSLLNYLHIYNNSDVSSFLLVS